MKRCNKCGFEQEEINFFVDRTKKDGLTTNCKNCIKRRNNEWKNINKEEQKLYNKNRRNYEFKLRERNWYIKRKNNNPNFQQERNKYYNEKYREIRIKKDKEESNNLSDKYIKSILRIKNCDLLYCEEMVKAKRMQLLIKREIRK